MMFILLHILIIFLLHINLKNSFHYDLILLLIYNFFYFLIYIYILYILEVDPTNIQWFDGINVGLSFSGTLVNFESVGITIHSTDSFSILPAVKYISHPLNFYSHIN